MKFSKRIETWEKIEVEGGSRTRVRVIHLEDLLNLVQHGKWTPSTALSAAASRAVCRICRGRSGRSRS